MAALNTKPLKDHLVQARVDDDELAALKKLQRLMGVKNQSLAIRQMITDEMMVEKAQQGWRHGQRDLVPLLAGQMNSDGRLPMANALLGITSTKTVTQLQLVQDQFADIQSQLAATLLSLTQCGNNLNQIAKVLNEAHKQAQLQGVDLADADLWNWVAQQLSNNNRVLNALKTKIANLKVQLDPHKKIDDKNVSGVNA